jgi:hypothetical protein
VIVLLLVNVVIVPRSLKMPLTVTPKIVPLLVSVVIVPLLSMPELLPEIVPLLVNAVIVPLLSIPMPVVVTIEAPLLTVKLHSGDGIKIDGIS